MLRLPSHYILYQVWSGSDDFWNATNFSKMQESDVIISIIKQCWNDYNMKYNYKFTLNQSIFRQNYEI